MTDNTNIIQMDTNAVGDIDPMKQAVLNQSIAEAFAVAGLTDNHITITVS